MAVTSVLDNGMARRFRQVVFQPLSDEEAARARQFAFSFHADPSPTRLVGTEKLRHSGVDGSV